MAVVQPLCSGHVLQETCISTHLCPKTLLCRLAHEHCPCWLVSTVSHRVRSGPCSNRLSGHMPAMCGGAAALVTAMVQPLCSGHVLQETCISTHLCPKTLLCRLAHEHCPCWLLSCTEQHNLTLGPTADMLSESSRLK